jgi:hypothetical protein
MLRVENIDARCAEIAEEMEQLMRILGVEAVVPECPPAGARPGSSRSATSPSARVRREGTVNGRRGTSAPASVGETVKIRY